MDGEWEDGNMSGLVEKCVRGQVLGGVIGLRKEWVGLRMSKSILTTP